ncbi:interferon a3-like [Trichomycterus rosablanca]|uniref:interferon a3-like n=1 Tax=Trichomycterus rosablanca TaxID=2290929 RepID=UPI002F35E435
MISLSCWNGAGGCTWMKSQNKASLSNFQVLSNSSIWHLQQACRHAVHDGSLSLAFPNKLYNVVSQQQANDHILFILKTLKSVMKIYRRKYEEVGCDQHKLQIFLLDVDRQIVELEQCAKNVVANKAQKRIFKKMETHFKRLISHLKKQDYSADGWNDIAGALLKHLRRLDLLATKTKASLH